MTTTRFLRSGAVLGLSSIFGAVVGYVLSSLFVTTPEQEFRASVSGIFLNQSETESIAKQYVQETFPSVAVLVRATPDSRSESRPARLAEMYSLGFGEGFEISEGALVGGGVVVQVETAERVDALKIQAWARNFSDATALAERAFSDLVELDEEFFFEANFPLSVVSESVHEPNYSSPGDRIDWGILEWVTRRHLNIEKAYPFLPAQQDSFRKVLALVSEDDVESGLDNTFVEGTVDDNRNWNLNLKGPDPVAVANAVSIFTELFRDPESIRSFDPTFKGTILVLSTSEPLSDQSSPTFSPIITSTVSGLLFGLAIGLAGLRIMSVRKASGPVNHE